MLPLIRCDFLRWRMASEFSTALPHRGCWRGRVRPPHSPKAIRGGEGSIRLNWKLTGDIEINRVFISRCRGRGPRTEISSLGYAACVLNPSQTSLKTWFPHRWLSVHGRIHSPSVFDLLMANHSGHSISRFGTEETSWIRNSSSWGTIECQQLHTPVFTALQGWWNPPSAQASWPYVSLQAS